MSPSINIVLDRLKGIRRNGNGFNALCPSHDDHNPSLSIRQTDDGKILLHCHAGCEPEQIVEKLGLLMAELFPEAEDQQPDPQEPQPMPRLILP